MPGPFTGQVLKFPITNPALRHAIDSVASQPTKEQALEKAYQLMSRRYRGYRFRTYLYFWRAFEKDPNLLWDRQGFLHCHQQNLLLRVLLVESGWFEPAEVEFGYSLVWYISPHQYLKVKLDSKTIALDPWNATYGAKINQYAVGFGFGEL